MLSATILLSNVRVNVHVLDYSSAEELLTYCSRDTRKRVFGKQWRPRSDAAECGVWSGSPLFANSLAIFL